MSSVQDEQQDRRFVLLTKGDNSPLDDTSFYPPGTAYLARDDIVEVVKRYVPFVGWITIWLAESVWMRRAFWAGLTVMVVMSNCIKESEAKESSNPLASVHIRCFTTLRISLSYDGFPKLFDSFAHC